MIPAHGLKEDEKQTDRYPEGRRAAGHWGMVGVLLLQRPGSRPARSVVHGLPTGQPVVAVTGLLRGLVGPRKPRLALAVSAGAARLPARVLELLPRGDERVLHEHVHPTRRRSEPGGVALSHGQGPLRKGLRYHPGRARGGYGHAGPSRGDHDPVPTRQDRTVQGAHCGLSGHPGPRPGQRLPLVHDHPARARSDHPGRCLPDLHPARPCAPASWT